MLKHSLYRTVRTKIQTRKLMHHIMLQTEFIQRLLLRAILVIIKLTVAVNKDLRQGLDQRSNTRDGLTHLGTVTGKCPGDTPSR
jgi:hypothetical protein